MIWDPYSETFVPVVPAVYHFSVLTLAGVVMLGVYLAPMILRPIDFLNNAGKYIIGLFSYLALMPMFINIFTIYAMANLHDVSWGNRPTSTGQEAFSQNKQEQEKAKQDYMVFRTNFCLFWYFCNGIYYFVILQLMKSMTSNQTYINTGELNYFEFFSMYLAGLVVFRVFFAILYLLLWRCRYGCFKSYEVKTFNLEDEFKRVKKSSVDGDSTDDEQMEQ
jgi:hypothetical protein